MIISIDPGFGNTKVCVDGKVSIIQTAVSRPKMIGMAAIGMRTATPISPVTLPSGAAYVAGEGAWHHGEPLSTMDYASLTSEPRLAIILYLALGIAAFLWLFSQL